MSKRSVRKRRHSDAVWQQEYMATFRAPDDRIEGQFFIEETGQPSWRAVEAYISARAAQGAEQERHRAKHKWHPAKVTPEGPHICRDHSDCRGDRGQSNAGGYPWQAIAYECARDRGEREALHAMLRWRWESTETKRVVGSLWNGWQASLAPRIRVPWWTHRHQLPAVSWAQVLTAEPVRTQITLYEALRDDARLHAQPSRRAT